MAKPTESNRVICASAVRPEAVPAMTCHSSITGWSGASCWISPSTRVWGGYSTKMSDRSRISRASSVLPGQSPPIALMCTPRANHVVVQDGGIVLVGRAGRHHLRAQHRLFLAGAGHHPQTPSGQVAGTFRRRRGIDVVEPDLFDPADRLEGQRLELGLRAVPDHRHHPCARGARWRAAMAEVAAVRSAVRIVISDRSTG